MSFVRYIISLIAALLFSTLGTSMAIAMSQTATDLVFTQAQTAHFSQAEHIGFTARVPPTTVANIAAAGDVTVKHGGAFVTHGGEARWASLNFGADLYAPNNAGAGRYTPSQPLDAAGNPIVRTNDRGGVLVQPNGSVTCGQHACGMVLNTQGRPVAVDDIIRTHGPDWCALL